MNNKISDEKLLAYLDGEAEAQIMSQIEKSPELINRAKELARIQNRLKTRLYRHMCPDSTELGEFHLGLLSNKRAREIKKHAAECLHCRKELAELQGFLGEEGPIPASGLSDQLKVLVAELVSGIPNNGSIKTKDQIPAFGLRGEKQDTLIYEVDKVQVIIDIQESDEDSSRKNLLGLITGLKAQAYRVSLIFEGKSIVNTQVNEVGNFVIPEISKGEYELIISGPEVEIQILSLKV